MSSNQIARRRRQRGAATMEYAGITVAAVGLVGVLIALLKSPVVQALLEALLRFVAGRLGLPYGG